MQKSLLGNNDWLCHHKLLELIHPKTCRAETQDTRLSLFFSFSALQNLPLSYNNLYLIKCGPVSCLYFYAMYLTCHRVRKRLSVIWQSLYHLFIETDVSIGKYMAFHSDWTLTIINVKFGKIRFSCSKRNFACRQKAAERHLPFGLCLYTAICLWFQRFFFPQV